MNISNISRWSLALWIMLAGLSVSMAQSLSISAFSSNYTASVTLRQPINSGDDYYSGAATITVFNQHHQSVVTVNSDDLFFDLKLGEASSNITELPYGEQSILIYRDMNFDGHKDLALMEGHYGCYGGPSFGIYLADGHGGFHRSDSYSALASDYCGMFQIDEKTQTLATMTKDGCCWHQFNTYAIKQGEPNLVQSVIEDIYTYPYERVLITHYQSGNPVKKVVEYHLDDDVLAKSMVFQFNLKGHPNKKVIILNNQGRLDYLMLNGDEVEYSSSLAANRLLQWQGGAQRTDMASSRLTSSVTFKWQQGRLSFQTGRTIYSIVDDGQRLGVEVKTADQTHFLNGDSQSKKGRLNAIGEHVYKNLAI